MSYTKTFMEDYLDSMKIKDIYKPIPINYLIYNLQTNQFRSSDKPSFNQQFERMVEVLSTEKDFTVFISHPIDEEYFFIDITDSDTTQSRIYDYYDFYDVTKNEITIIQDYTVFIDCNSNVYNATITKYSCEKKIDTFEVVHFSKFN